MARGRLVGRRRGRIAMWLLPFVLIAALVGGIFFHAPFLLWALIWVAVILKITGHRRRHRHQQLSRPGPR